MSQTKSAKNSQHKEHLERTYGKGAFVSKSWVKQTLSKSKAKPKVKTLVSPKLSTKTLSSSLEAIREELGDCKRCGLCETRTNIVFGEGNPKAQLMFVGEGPGENEDQQGRPFVGRAGQLLDKIIEAMGMKREDVFIANVVKCRPPNNRQPEPVEAQTCKPFLLKQIQVIQPKIIVALGSTALQHLLDKEAKISKMRGSFTDFSVEGFTAKFMPTFHPAYLLRNPPAKKEVWEDMKKVMEALGSA